MTTPVTGSLRHVAITKEIDFMSSTLTDHIVHPSSRYADRNDRRHVIPASGRDPYGRTSFAGGRSVRHADQFVLDVRSGATLTRSASHAERKPPCETALGDVTCDKPGDVTREVDTAVKRDEDLRPGVRSINAVTRDEDRLAKRPPAAMSRVTVPLERSVSPTMNLYSDKANIRPTDLKGGIDSRLHRECQRKEDYRRIQGSQTRIAMSLIGGMV